jgi:hypothetical protein
MGTQLLISPDQFGFFVLDIVVEKGSGQLNSLTNALE